MDYEAIDKYMSRGAVQCEKGGTRFFLTSEGLATDLPDRAARFRDFHGATQAATTARSETAWTGFEWEPVYYFTIYEPATKGA